MTLNPTCRGRVAGHSLLNNVFVTRKEQSKDQFNKKRLSDNKVHGLQAKNKIKKSFYLDRQVIVERTPFFFFFVGKMWKELLNDSESHFLFLHFAFLRHQ